MTKNESEILLFIKSNPNVEKDDILKNDFKIHPNHVIAALTWLHRVGYVATHPVCPEYTDLQTVHGMLNFDITAKGLHELDEYLENQTRLDKAEKLSEEANSLSKKANGKSDEANSISKFAAFFTAIASITAVVALCISIANVH